MDRVDIVIHLDGVPVDPDVPQVLSHTTRLCNHFSQHYKAEAAYFFPYLNFEF